MTFHCYAHMQLSVVGSVCLQQFSSIFESTIQYIVGLFVCFVALRPSQQLWS